MHNVKWQFSKPTYQKCVIYYTFSKWSGDLTFMVPTFIFYDVNISINIDDKYSGKIQTLTLDDG